MAQIQANPWSFVTADQASSFAITSIVRNAQGSALVTCAAHGFTGNEQISIQGTATTGWRGGYRVLAVPSATTFLVKIPDYKNTLANNGATGNVLTAAYLDMIRGEQILWDGPTATNVLSLTDVNGNLVWNPTALTGGTLTYGKVFWIRGLVLNSIPSGTVQMTVN